MTSKKTERKDIAASETVAMFDLATNHTGDIHPNEVDNMLAHGWRLCSDGSQRKTATQP